jgi:hypothetical protein
MHTLVAGLYFIATLLSAYVLLKRPDWMMLIVLVFALGIAFDEMNWFLTYLYSPSVDWPAQNFAGMFAVAVKGVSTPTTIPELAMVAGGRLIALMTVFYGSFLAFFYGSRIVAHFKAMPVSTLSLLALWEGCLLISFVGGALSLSALTPLIAVLKIIGAIACLLYLFNEIYLMSKTPSSVPPSA